MVPTTVSSVPGKIVLGRGSGAQVNTMCLVTAWLKALEHMLTMHGSRTYAANVLVLQCLRKFCCCCHYSMQEMMNLYPDRVITIRGSIENMVEAESLISSKLLECIERDMQQANMVGAYDHRRSIYR